MKQLRRVALTLLLCQLTLATCGQQTPTWQEQYDLGVRYLEDGSYEDAILAFTAAIEIAPKQAPAYVGRGNAYVSSGEMEENLTAAQADYELAIELNASNVEAYLGLADVYIRRGEYDQALDILQQGLENTSNSQIIADKLAKITAGNFEDSSGNLRCMKYHDESGNAIWWHDYSYNSRGQKISMTVYDAAGNQADYWDGYKYDELGNCIYSAGYSLSDGTVTTYSSSTFDGTKLIRTDLYISSTGKPGGYHEYEYDKDGNCIKTIAYHTDGTPSVTWINSYDQNGNRVKMTNYHADGTSSGYETYTYDESGRMTGSYRYDSNGKLKGYVEY